MADDHADVAIVGGGVMGLSIAGELAKADKDVALFEKDDYCYREASYASGGMLAPFMEVEFGETDLLEINRRSLKLWDEFARSLVEETGKEIGYHRQGSCYVATYQREEKELDRLFHYQQQLDLPVERRSPAQARRNFPGLTDKITGVVYAPEEGHVNNRWLGLALHTRCKQYGVSIYTGEAVNEIHRENRFVVKTDRLTVEADTVLITAGSWAGQIDGLPADDQIPVRPLKGQACSLQWDAERMPRCVIRGKEIYCVPHPPERLLIGASVEEEGYSRTRTAGKLMDLLFAACEILPELKDSPLIEHWTGFRPASLDNKPVMGPSRNTPGLYFATGHNRNGILLVPFTTKVLSKAILNDTVPEPLEPFLPGRFSD